MGDLVVSYFTIITIVGTWGKPEELGNSAGAGIGAHYALCVGRGSLHNLRFGLVVLSLHLWLYGSAGRPKRKYSFTSPAL